MKKNQHDGGIQKYLRKTMRIMRLSLFLIVLSTAMAFSANSYSQSTKLTLDMNNATVKEVIKAIENQSEFLFFYQEEHVDLNRQVTLHATNQNVETILNQLFAKTNNIYVINDRQIVIGVAPRRELEKQIQRIDVNLKPVIEQPQQKEITGKVTDSDGLPLPGVSIVVKGTTIGTVTNNDGEFALNVPLDAETLQFSFVGMRMQEVALDGRTAFTVVMEEETIGIEEVVSIAYGTQKKTSLTSAVSTIKGETVSSIPVSNLSSSMGGRLSGVITKQTSGEPGQDVSDIYIRGISSTGSTSPLVVVDGIPRDFNHLDPNSIESFTILKDASAIAPYGVAGANGVILVTTKSAQKGTPKLTYNSFIGFQNPTVLPNYLNGYQFAVLKNAANENIGLPKIYSDDELKKFKDGSDPDAYPPYFNIWDDIRNKNAIMHRHNIEISGGSEKTKYNASLGYFNQEGMWKWKTSNSEKFNILMNIESKVTEYTNVILKVSGSVEDYTHPPGDRPTDITPYQQNRRVMEQIGFAHPGTGALEFTNGLYGRAVVPILKGDGGYYKSSSQHIYTQLSVEQKIPFIPGLEIKGTVAYDPNSFKYRKWLTPFSVSKVNTSTSPYSYTTNIYNQSKPSLTEEWNQNYQMTYQAIANYTKTIGEFHNIGIMGVFEARSLHSSNLYAAKQNYDLYIDEISMGSSDTKDWSMGGTSSNARQIGLVYRLTYNFKNKYLIESSGRYDGHYYFAPEKRFGFFPSISAGWRASEENFIKNRLAWLNNLKFRASYGEVGALAGSGFQYLNSYNVFSSGYVFGDTGVQKVVEDTEANPNISWEKAKKLDIGFDLSLLKGRFNLEVDYFYEKRSNMLVIPDVEVPAEYGIGLSQVNAGVMENKGIDLSFSSNHKLSNDFRISVNGTFTYAKNKVLQIFETDETFDNSNRRLTGRSLYTQFGYHAIGFFQIEDFDAEGNLNPEIAIQPWGKVFPGDIRYKDMNDDGKIDINDHTVIGLPNQSPQIIYGFGPYIHYKSWSLDILFQGVAQTDLRYKQEMAWAFYGGRNALVENFDYWTEENTNAKNPRITPSITKNNRQNSSFWMRNASYLRLKNFTISYNLPPTLLKKIGAVKIFTSGQNILTWTKMTDKDPEGWNRTYPQQKVISFGINVIFKN